MPSKYSGRSNAAGRRLFEEVLGTSADIVIFYAKGTALYSGGNAKLAKIGYDPRSGMKISTPTGLFSKDVVSKQSPVSGLVHEVGHAARYLAGTALTVPSVCGGNTFPLAEEQIVTDTYETPFSSSINDGVQKLYVHGKSDIKAKCPLPSCAF